MLDQRNGKLLGSTALRGLGFTLLTVAAACSKDSTEAQRADPTIALEGPVIASTWPVASMAKAILGPEHPVRCLIPPGHDPAFWQPSEADRQAFLQAPGILLNGARFEPWAATANLPATRTVLTGEAVRSSWIEIEEGPTHSHGTQGSHSHVGFDPHLWMDPLLALEQARAIQGDAIALEWIDASAAAENFAALEDRLRELDALWIRISESLRGPDQAIPTLLANHGTYTYPAKRYGLVVAVIDVDPEGTWWAEHRAALARVEGSPKYFLFEAAPSPELERELRENHQLIPVVLRPAESPIEGFASALDVWQQDLTAFHQLLQTTQSHDE